MTAKKYTTMIAMSTPDRETKREGALCNNRDRGSCAEIACTCPSYGTSISKSSVAPAIFLPVFFPLRHPTGGRGGAPRGAPWARRYAAGPVESRSTNSVSITMSCSMAEGWSGWGISESQMICPMRSRGMHTVVRAG